MGTIAVILLVVGLFSVLGAFALLLIFIHHARDEASDPILDLRTAEDDE